MRSKVNKVAAIILILLAQTHAQGQASTIVRSVRAETNDALSFRIWTKRSTVRLGDDVRVFFEIRNRSRRSIYLVRRTAPDATPAFTTYKDQITVMAPVPFPYGHGRYDYSFTKIGRNGFYVGEITVPGENMGTRNGEWLINVAFSYVTNISGLRRKLLPGEAPENLRGMLGDRIKTVSLGDLCIEAE